ncbi:LysM-like peptidoglycan-binding domain-containing protein [Photobacterium sp. MCCC 1A19761]|uniref:LysM-like peptidoglycan-binding domain-containing protein n=1 Tax=Photobacterium sp. MCCC 1A19761 TaxID=3115000 RepID=UPI00307E51A8
MGQARRRSKKKSEFTFPRFSLSQLKTLKTGAITARGAAAVSRVKSKWDALPVLHRRALAVLTPVVGILLLLPAKAPLPDDNAATVRREVTLDIGQPQRQDLPPVGQRPEPPSPQRTQVATAASETGSGTTASRATVSSASAPVEAAPSAAIAWQTYQVKQGETLANIFRDKSLPLGDLYAVAAIEGKDKPLSRIKAGQLLRYKQTAQGDLDVLQIESRSGEPVMFFRRSDGSFARSQ